MNPFTWFWLGWASLGVGVELYAFFSDAERGTLSANVWHYITKPKSETGAAVVVWAGRVGVASFLVWLLGHLTFGWWSL